jgi:hypothetical protein
VGGVSLTIDSGKNYPVVPLSQEVIMKAATVIQQAIRLIILCALGAFLALAPQQAQAQDNGDSEPSGKYSREELAQMLAPIALYPDALLSQVLMASTYPIEVIEADRWVKKNPELKDEALDDALLANNWDPSVKAMCHFPSILALMSDRIAETTNIGNAFLAQEEEVMDMVQELRAKAYAQGNLTTTSEQKVIVEKETIIIEPANPRVVYVPYYDPFYIYGPWWYPAYPPYYWWPSGVSIGVGLSYWPAFYFGYSFGTWSYFDWHRHYVYIDVNRRPRYVRHDRWISTSGAWAHAPSHRRGVAYHDKSTAVRYGQYPYRTRAFRHETRGFPEQTVRSRSTDGRTITERDIRGGARTQSDRDKRQQQPSVLETQNRERTRSVQQERTKVEPSKQESLRTSMPDQQKRARIQPDRQESLRTSRPEQQERTRIEPDRQQERQRVERDRQMQQRADQETQKRQQVEREFQQRSPDNVFNRVDDGRREVQSSERGRSSRQGQSSEFHGSGQPPGGDNRGGRSQRQGPR